jgi:hypothetical protein
MKNLTQAKIRELLEDIARIEMVLQVVVGKDFNQNEAEQYAGGYATLAIAKAKLTSLQKGDR